MPSQKRQPGVRNSDYLAWVREQPCRVCGHSPCDAHHVIGHGRLAMAMKVEDLFTLPLCRQCHGHLHDKGWRDWEHVYGNQLLHAAKTMARYITETHDRTVH